MMTRQREVEGICSEVMVDESETFSMLSDWPQSF